MNMLSRFQPPLPKHGSDELEGVLREFFRAQLPDPWPALMVPSEPPAKVALARPVPRPWTLARSRVALAASVALLLVGSWWLLGQVSSDPTSWAARADFTETDQATLVRPAKIRTNRPAANEPDGKGRSSSNRLNEE
jgi:hypothetical protein